MADRGPMPRRVVSTKPPSLAGSKKAGVTCGNCISARRTDARKKKHACGTVSQVNWDVGCTWLVDPDAPAASLPESAHVTSEGREQWPQAAAALPVLQPIQAYAQNAPIGALRARHGDPAAATIVPQPYPLQRPYAQLPAQHHLGMRAHSFKFQHVHLAGAAFAFPASGDGLPTTFATGAPVGPAPATAAPTHATQASDPGVRIRPAAVLEPTGAAAAAALANPKGDATPPGMRASMCHQVSYGATYYNN